MVRFGEMMVVIRAQDYASRTLHKVSGELAGMSRAQAMAQKQMVMSAKQARLASKIDLSKGHLTNLKVIKDRIAASEKLTKVQQNLARAERFVEASRGVERRYKNPYRRDAEAAVRRLRNEQGVLTKQLSEYQRMIDAMPSKYGRMALATSSLGSGMADLNAAYKAGIINARELGVQERLLIDEFDAHTRAIQRMPLERLHRIGAAMSGLGRTMQLFGAVGVGGFALAANSFAKFSSSAATAGTQMRNLGGQGGDMQQAVERSQELQKAILEMAMVFPIGAQDMTEAAYDIFSSMNLMHNGVMDVESGLRLLAVANKAAVAGQVDLKEASNAMIVALNIFDPQLKDVKGTMDEVFNIVRFGKFHLDDLSHTFTQFASAAKSGGLELKEIGAAFATATLFQDVGKASAGVGRLVEFLRLPEFQKGLKNLTDIDVISPDTGKMKPLLTLFQEIAKARPDLVASRKAAIDFTLELTKASGLTKKGVQGTVQYRRTFEALITHMQTFAETTKNIRNNTDEMNKAFYSRMADPGVQWELFLNRMKALALVIGKAVLPVFIKIGEWVYRFIQFMQRLNNGTGSTIIRLAAWAAVGTLVAGVLLSMSGGVTQLIATLALLRIAAIQAGTGFTVMRTLMMASGIGAIVIGSGIAAAAVMTHWDEVRAYFRAWRDDVGEGFKHFWSEQWDAAKHTGANIITLFGKIMPGKYAGDAIQDWAKGVSRSSLKDIEDRTDSFTASYAKWLKFYKSQHPKSGMDWLKDFKRITGEFDNRKLSEAYKKWANTVGDTTYTAAQRAKDHAQAVKQATENMENTIKTATTNLVNLYEQMQTANRTALGGLFQGPTMQGVLGGVFKNINDSLRQFGVQIPVPFKILKQDLQQSLTYFKRWRGGINKLLKRGVPHEMLQELQAMGPEGIPIIEGLLQAPKGQFRGIIKMYKQGQTLTDKATKEDMNRKLKYWNQFGKDAAWQMIMGIITNPKNAKIAKMYEDYVKTTYGSILQKTFQDDVATYMATALANAKAQAAAANIMPTGMPSVFAPTPKKGSKAELAAMTPQQLTATYKQNAAKLAMLNPAILSPNFMGPVRPGDKRRLINLRHRRQAILAEYRHDATPAARRALGAHRRSGSRAETFQVTYHGDTVTIKADGATVASITRALQKKHFKKKTKNTKGTVTNYPGPGR